MEIFALWKMFFHSIKGLTASHMPPGHFGTLAPKSLPHFTDVDLRLMCQMGFSLIQHQKPAHVASLSPPLVALQIVSVA